MKAIAKKLLAFQSEIGTIKKDSKNPHFKNTYASLPQILSEVKPLLTKHGLVLLQPILVGFVNTTIIDSESGEQVTADIKIPEGLTAQQTGSAISYFRRYGICSLLSLEVDDDDANEASKPKAKPSITAGQFEAIVKRIQEGEDIYNKVVETYTLTSEQLGTLNKILA